MSNVVNHELGVTSTTSQQTIATDGACDVNLDPSKKVPTGHENQADTALAVDHAQRTEATGGPVVRVDDKVANPSAPAHADTGGGINSGTYIHPGRATEGAPDVRVEGARPARKDDPGMNNDDNSASVVRPAGQPRQATIGPNERVKEDTIIKVWATCGHGRNSISAKGEYLGLFEMHGGESLKLNATRGNVRPPNKQDAPGKAVCQFSHQAKGTEWVLKSKIANDPKAKEQTEKMQGDEITVPDHLLEPDQGFFALLDNNASEFNVDNSERSNLAGAKARSIAQNARSQKWAAGQNAKWQPVLQRRDQQIDAQRNATAGAIQTAGRVGLGLLAAYNFFRWSDHPLQVTAEASACSGRKELTINLYPAAEYEVDVGELIASIRKTVEALKQILGWLKTLLSGVGFGNSFDGNVEVCTQTTVKFEFAFAERKEDKVVRGNQLLKHTMGREFKLVFETMGVVKEAETLQRTKNWRQPAQTHSTGRKGKLVGFQFILRCSLLKLLLLIGVPPHIIDRVEGWLRKWKVRADLELRIDFGIGLKFEVGVDEYWQVTSLTPFVQAILNIFFGAVIQIGSYTVECGFVCEWTPGVTIGGPAHVWESWKTLKIDLDRFKAGISAVAKKNVWGFDVEFGDTWYPDFMTFVLGELEWPTPFLGGT